MSYKVIIPTYKRQELLFEKTLATIRKTNLDLSNLTIWTADTDNEYEKYVEESKRRIEWKNQELKFIKGVRGLPNQHNLIQDTFGEGQNLLIMDDDISEICYLKDGKAVPLVNLHEFVEQAFQITESWKMKCWGANANCNPLIMQNAYSVGLIYIVQNFFGIINTHDKRLYVDTGDEIPLRKTFNAGKESHERVIRNYINYGGVIKFKNVGAKGQYWTTKGGLEASRTNEGEKQASEYFVKRYPHLVREREFQGRPDLEFIGGKTKVFELNHINKPNQLYEGLF